RGALPRMQPTTTPAANAPAIQLRSISSPPPRARARSLPGACLARIDGTAVEPGSFRPGVKSARDRRVRLRRVDGRARLRIALARRDPARGRDRPGQVVLLRPEGREPRRRVRRRVAGPEPLRQELARPLRALEVTGLHLGDEGGALRFLEERSDGGLD